MDKITKIIYAMLALMIYIIIVFVVGFIRYKEDEKRKIMSFLSAIYNFCMGYIDTMFFIFIYAFCSNQPKGSGYEVPESEASFNLMIGLVLLGIYMLMFVPLNLYMKMRGKISTKTYLKINGIATVLGVILFWIFLDKSKTIF